MANNTKTVHSNMRYSYNNRNREGGKITYFNWSPEQDRWVADNQDDVSWNKFDTSYMIDDRAWSLPIMQDCILSRFETSQFQSYTLSTDELERKHTCVWMSPGRMARVPTEYIMSEAYRRNNAVHAFSGICQEAIELHAVVNSQVYTKGIKIQESPFKSDFSIWFLITDLIQLPHLVKSLFANRALLRKLQRQQVLRPANCSAVANSYLAVKFGALPTLADLREFCTLFCKWGLMYSKLNPRLRHGFTAYAPHQVVIPQKRVVLPMSAHVALSDIPISLSCDVSNAVLYGTLKYYFDCPELSGFLNRMKQLVDSLGILDPSAVWDIIPFSFVVDWFFPVGRWLQDNLKPQLFPANVIACDFCESIGRRMRITATMTWRMPDQSGPGYSTQTNQLWLGSAFQYTRRRKFPCKLAIEKRALLPNKSPVRIGRILVGTAITVQKAHNVARGPKSPCYADRY